MYVFLTNISFCLQVGNPDLMIRETNSVEDMEEVVVTGGALGVEWALGVDMGVEVEAALVQVEEVGGVHLGSIRDQVAVDSLAQIGGAQAVVEGMVPRVRVVDMGAVKVTLNQTDLPLVVMDSRMDMEVNKGEELVVVGPMIGPIRWPTCSTVGLVNNRPRDSLLSPQEIPHPLLPCNEHISFRIFLFTCNFYSFVRNMFYCDYISHFVSCFIYIFFLNSPSIFLKVTNFIENCK